MSEMYAHIDCDVSHNCKNPDSYGMICVKCNQCGRFNGEADGTLTLPKEALDDLEKLFAEERRNYIMTRSEHLVWCKQRALEYVEAGDLKQAVASMSSDMSKHEETNSPSLSVLTLLGMMEIQNGSDAVRRWINGFN